MLVGYKNKCKQCHERKLAQGIISTKPENTNQDFYILSIFFNPLGTGLGFLAELGKGAPSRLIDCVWESWNTNLAAESAGPSSMSFTCRAAGKSKLGGVCRA